MVKRKTITTNKKKDKVAGAMLTQFRMLQEIMTFSDYLGQKRCLSLKFCHQSHQGLFKIMVAEAYCSRPLLSIHFGKSLKVHRNLGV